MNRKLAAILLLLLLCCPIIAGQAASKTVTFQNQIKLDVNAEYVNLKSVKAESISSLIRFLRQFKNLKKVDMFATVVDKNDIKKLEKAFPHVEFGWTMYLCSCMDFKTFKYLKHTVRTDATVFSTRHLSYSNHHTNQDFDILKYCKNMMALDLGHNNVTNLDFVKSMPNLRILIIGRNRVTDLTPLASCKNLEYLEAFTNPIESVAPLLECKHLMDLNIPNCRIKDPLLMTKMTWLKRLWIFNYASFGEFSVDIMPASVKSKIKKALPNCVVNTYAAGTTAWRDGGKHDKTVQEIFKTGKYTPFHDGLPYKQNAGK